jgi:hypothetical protein
MRALPVSRFAPSVDASSPAVPATSSQGRSLPTPVTDAMIRKALALLLAPLLGASRPTPVAAQPPAREQGQAVFNDAFTAGYRATIDGDAVRFVTQDLGTFRLPSGQLVACDPFWCEDGQPFTQPVPRGEFPLTLAIADFGNQRRIAFARLAFSAEPVVRWELALVEGQDPSTLQPGEFFGYGVDAGTGAFMDRDAWRAFNAQMEQDEAFDGRLVDEMQKAGGVAGWLLFASGPGSVAMFSSGWGDGEYATYWGYDAAGNLAAALTDFYVVDWNPQPGDG